MKRVKILLTVFLLITLIATISSASYDTVKMEVVEKPTSTVKFATNSYVERSVISQDLEKKEITLQLKVVNGEESLKPTGEIMLVIDNSKSMEEAQINDTSSGKVYTRKDLIMNSAQILVTNLLKDNSQLKIGAVSFSTNADTSKEGTIEDAQLISKPTNDSTALNSAIDGIKATGPRTDLQSGLVLAKQQFSDDVDKDHKYIIVLTDGLPNIMLNDTSTTYSLDRVVKAAHDELASLSDVVGNHVYTMLTGINNGSSTYVTGSDKTYDEVIKEVFGTADNPTIGKFYYVTDSNIENTVTNQIYNDLKPIAQSIKNIKVNDYFTNEIVKNFDFSYVKNPNYGTISDKIDTKTNSSTWNIPELKSGETAIVQYKLKLKKGYDESIVNKVINTNTKLEVSYTDPSTNKETSKSSTVTPKLKLTEPAVKEDLPKVLPKAGTTITFSILGVAAIIAIGLGIRYNKIKNNMK